MASDQLQNSNLLAFDPVTPSNLTTFQILSTAATFVAYSFIAQTTTTLSGFRAWCSSVVGTLGANDIVATLYSDALGVPGSSMGSSNTLSSTITANTWTIFTSWTGTLAITAGTRYWIVLSNVNATPASNKAQFNWGGANTGDGVVVGSGPKWGYTAGLSTNSGSTWTMTAGSCGWRVDLADGTYLGLPISKIAAGTNAAGVAIFGTREFGVKFVAPTNFPANVTGIAFHVTLTGSPTGNLNFVLRDVTAGTTVASTYAVPTGNITGTMWITAYFTAGTQALVGGHTYRATIADSASNSDSTTNYYAGYQYTQDTDANSLAQFLYSMEQTYTTNQGSTWSDTSGIIVPFGLVLDTNGEFQSGGGGGGMIYQPDMAGGCVG